MNHFREQLGEAKEEGTEEGGNRRVDTSCEDEEEEHITDKKIRKKNEYRMRHIFLEWSRS